MLYDDIHNWLGWPDWKQTFEPHGAGAKVYAEFARKKLSGVLSQAHPGMEIRVGVIAADPNSDSSESPLALVCEFPRAVSEAVLNLTHQLAWNFSRTALLITLEPHQIIAWSCYQDPTQQDRRRVCELPVEGNFQFTGTKQQRVLRDLLHWVNLITQRAQNTHPEKFPADGRADALLLKNLRYVRGELLNMGLVQEHCHDLLARVIFTQFLFHRKDSDGNSFFSESKMKRLHESGVLSRICKDLSSVLSDKTDTYALFRWMDERFNGDLFPGRDDENDSERDAAWRVERDAVSEKHLDLLSRLIRGDLVASDNQLLLWPYYSFDTIPLEFISSVYEEFLTAEERGNDKAYYTPSHLVDYVLDAVLPWNSTDWNVRILDPCCGSAIFLVKAFQRLIHRWRLSEKRDPLVTDLRPILESNLMGIDKNPEAIRVACFSLYLAMADAIEPKHYVTRDNIKVFPRLRGTRLVHRDFFDEETKGIRTIADKESFDLVLGNAAWGDGSIETDPMSDEERISYAKRVFGTKGAKSARTRAQIWAKENGWPVANNDIGPLFLAKAAALVKPTGLIAMVNTASLLYWRDGQAVELRKKFFTSYTFEEVTNLSALRRELFSEAIGPSCIVVFRTVIPNKQEFLHYYSPKPIRSIKLQRGKPTVVPGFSVEPHDIALISHAQASEDPWAWSALAVGGNRHLSLVRRLSTYPTLEKLETCKEVETRKGVIPGKRELHFPQHKNKPILESPDFPADVFLELDASTLPLWENPRTTSGDSKDFSAFKSPQVFIKLSYSARLGRMRAVHIKKHPLYEETICQGALVTFHDLTEDQRHIRSACLAYNSKFAVWFFGLTSTSFPLYTCKLTVRDLLKLPLPSCAPDLSRFASFDEIDESIRKTLGLNTADWALIEDFLDYTLPDILRKTPGPARSATQRIDKEGIKEPEMVRYAKTFARVIKGTFGNDREVSSTIFTEPDPRKLPVRMLTIHLDVLNQNGVKIETIEADGLLDKLADFHQEQLTTKPRDITGNGLGFQRIAYFFRPVNENGCRTMNLTIVKPDERRYWTRSMAMRDADQLAAAIRRATSLRKSDA